MYNSNQITLCSGVYNGLTPDHCRLLEYANTLGLPVIVGINSDEYNLRKNGIRAIPASDRTFLLKSIKWVDDVMVFTESNPSELILNIRPRYYIKGPDYRGVPLIEEPACIASGTTILFRPGDYVYGSSTIFK